MAKLYTQAELCQANLPGFNSGATLSEALKPTTDWQTVLSLTLIRRDPDGSLRIQSGIRRADTNFTHPDVVSTPTGRLPRFIVGQLMAEKRVFLEDEAPWRLTEINPQEPQVVARFSGNAETLPENESVLPYIASNLLAKKLGCAASLEQSTSDIPFGSVSLATVLAGFSYASDGYDDRG